MFPNAFSSPNMPSAQTRNDWLLLSDEDLLRQCEFDTYRASGPGGQKRNKTSSAVRLRHTKSGLLVIAEESRSQHENKARALKRLRFTMALELRQPLAEDPGNTEVLSKHRTPEGGISISRRSEAYNLLAAVVLDFLNAHEGRLREASGAMGLTTAQLSKFIADEGKLLAAANRIRQQRNLGPIRANE